MSPYHDKQEIEASRRLGRDLPLAEGLAMLADYLSGLRGALSNQDLAGPAMAAMPSWEAYVRGLRGRIYAIAAENRPRRRP